MCILEVSLGEVSHVSQRVCVCVCVCVCMLVQCVCSLPIYVLYTDKMSTPLSSLARIDQLLLMVTPDCVAE